MNPTKMIVAALVVGGVAQAAQIATESFAYAPDIKLAGGTANGGTGWADGWQAIANGGIRMDKKAQSLWFGNSPVFLTDGSGVTDGLGGYGSVRNLAQSHSLAGKPLYFAALVRVCTTSQCRFEFFTEPNGTGAMRFGFGLSSINEDSQPELFVSSATPGYPKDQEYYAPVGGTTGNYLLVAKRTGDDIFASLIRADGSGAVPVEPVDWDITAKGKTGMTLQSLKVSVSKGVTRVDEIRIGTTFADVVDGLRVNAVIAPPLG